MSEPGVLRGSKPVVISCVGLWPCATASEAQHYEKVGVQMNESFEEANPGSILNLNQDAGGTGSCHDEAPAFGLCIVHNPAEILRTSGGFNTACSSENLLGWKETCEEYEEDLYCEVHPKNESKPSSSSSSRKKHSPGQMTLSGVKLQDMKYYSAMTYSGAGVKVSIYNLTLWYDMLYTCLLVSLSSLYSSYQFLSNHSVLSLPKSLQARRGRSLLMIPTKNVCRSFLPQLMSTTFISSVVCERLSE